MVELMLVIVVIGILSCLALHVYSRVLAKARSSEVAVVFGALGASQAAYHGPAGTAVPASYPKGQSLYSAARPADWYYTVARCDWDGVPAVNEIAWQAGDMLVLHREHEGQ
jgi:type II secretory pathway pseudopilin PulG